MFDATKRQAIREALETCGQHWKQQWRLLVLRVGRCLARSGPYDWSLAIANWAYWAHDIDLEMRMDSSGFPVFLGCHNVEKATLTPQQRGDFFVSPPAWGPPNGCCRLLSVLSSPFFAYFSSTILDDKSRYLQYLRSYYCYVSLFNRHEFSHRLAWLGRSLPGCRFSFLSLV